MDGWQTKIVPFVGGLITNQSPYQQGFNNEGSARILINYEPSVKGGYRRINGYRKAVSTPVPYYGNMYVQGSGQFGTQLIIGSVFENLEVTDTFVIAGDATEYTVTSRVIDTQSATTTLQIYPTLFTTPPDKALVTVTSSATNKIYGLKCYNQYMVAHRGGSMFRNAGPINPNDTSVFGWEQISVPYLGDTVTVAAASSGNTLYVTGCTEKPSPNITLQVDGIELTYRIDAVVATGTGPTDYTLTVYPALATSPSIGAAVTTVGYNCADIDPHILSKPILEVVEFHIGLQTKLAIATGTRFPAVFEGDTGKFMVLSGIPADAEHPTSVAYNKFTLFLGVDDKLYFSAPANYADYSPANGSGFMSIGNTITQLITFREQVIVFGRSTISRITGTTLSDFQLLNITRDLGCLRKDSIREVGGDIMFLGPDGLRMLGATDRIGDFNLDPVSSNIQNAVSNLVNTFPDAQISSVVVRSKSQYRLFAFGSSFINGKGLLGANLLSPEGSTYWAWSELKDLEVMFADSEIVFGAERICFINSTGFAFWMEEGNSFDGAPISATYATPFLPFDDPELRKTMYKMFLYIDPEGSVNVKSSLKFDFNDPDVILPSSKEIVLSNEATAPTQYGSLTAAYGIARYGGSLRAVFKTQLVGSAFAISFFFQSNDTNPPYTLDTMTIEYAMRGRR